MQPILNARPQPQPSIPQKEHQYPLQRSRSQGSQSHRSHGKTAQPLPAGRLLLLNVSDHLRGQSDDGIIEIGINVQNADVRGRHARNGQGGVKYRADRLHCWLTARG